ncbi:MAG: biotin--[acetyl-CoA-carboxylase] ligase [Calditrichaeota bacterium]|nr:biotin--[acetyl-CoA-carboxylase] ligase [Calditrichota bacterium]
MKIIGRKIIHFDSISSTNDVLKEKALAGEHEGLVITAEEQTKGRGRGANCWLSMRGKGLYFSVLLRPQINARDVGIFSLFPSIALADAIAHQSETKATTKWPNDVFLTGKKVAGILGESSATSQKINFVIVGAGINILHEQKDFPPDFSDSACSIKSATGKTVDKFELLHEILFRMESIYSQINNFADWQHLITDEWMKRCLHLERKVIIKNNTFSKEGIFERISTTGEALIRTENGVLEKITVGNFSLRET